MLQHAIHELTRNPASVIELSSTSNVCNVLFVWSTFPRATAMHYNNELNEPKKVVRWVNNNNPTTTMEQSRSALNIVDYFSQKTLT
jgi:hypothetical protein